MEATKEKYLTAIICIENDQIREFKKYRNISNTEKAKERFMSFARKFKGVKHVNFYNKEAKTFVNQTKAII